MTTTVASANKAHPLAPAVLRQLGGGRDAVQSALDAGNHGADGGFPGFTYYSDTVPFAKRHRKAILACCEAMASDLGEGDAVQLVAGFRCLKDLTRAEVCAVLTGTNTDEDVATTVWNALAWFALEEVGRAIEGIQV